MVKAPKVSIVSISYNQELYIEQMLQSFVDQIVTFDIEIIVADDCSTDNTAAIIRKYAKKYPKLFKPILRDKNLGVQRNLVSALQAAKGEYVALCEGDDYWTDPQKLQKQVDFMTTNSEYALCFHPVKVVFENKAQSSYTYPESDNSQDFTLENLLTQNYIQTNSVLYRRVDYAKLPVDIMPVDWYLHVYHAQFGKIGFVPENMAVYRKHENGIWWTAISKDKLFWNKYMDQHLRLFESILSIYATFPRYSDSLMVAFSGIIDSILAAYDRELPKEIISNHAALFSAYIDYQKRIEERAIKHAAAQEELLVSLHLAVKLKQDHIANLEESIDNLQESIDNLQDQISAIHRTKSWRLSQKLGKIKKYLFWQ
jgi:glycosyltransferase involved in cell wall biosynthesis